MSPKKSLLATGLTALGLVGFAPFVGADPPNAPSGHAPSAAPTSSNAVLLLKNGGVVQGLISEDQSGYVLHVKGSKRAYRKVEVVGLFKSMDDAYQYQHDQLVARDPDENMKLARWCLLNRLNDKAKIELEAVLALSPKNREATAMLDKINNTEERMALRDSGVVQANAVVEEERLNRVDRATLDRASREMGVTGLPQIPGLPAVAAVRRVEEFRRNVHLVLQTYCARCHNETYPGEFRLVQIKTRADNTPDAFRNNLDATLRLVNLETPGRSELLSSTLRPHGTGNNKRPVFAGSNDRSYQILARWVDNLHASPREQQNRTRSSRPFVTVENEAEGNGGERFASRRSDGVPLPLTPAPSSVPRSQNEAENPEPVPLAPGQLLPGSGSGMDAYAPPGTEFPAPYLLGGPKPKLAQQAAEDLKQATRMRQAAAGARTPQAGQPADISEGVPVGAADVEVPKSKKPAKPVKVDPELLQRALMNRNVPQ